MALLRTALPGASSVRRTLQFATPVVGPWRVEVDEDGRVWLVHDTESLRQEHELAPSQAVTLAGLLDGAGRRAPTISAIKDAELQLGGGTKVGGNGPGEEGS